MNSHRLRESSIATAASTSVGFFDFFGFGFVFGFGFGFFNGIVLRGTFPLFAIVGILFCFARLRTALLYVWLLAVTLMRTIRNQSGLWS